MNNVSTLKDKNVKIKICGLFREDDIVAVNSTLPDFIGFIFAKSPRRVDFELAKKLKTNLDEKIQTAGVFVNEKIENILKLYEAKIIDIVQLHGDEDEKYIETLKNRADLKVIKSIKAGTQQVLPENADWILFDTPSEKLRGGTGKTFDWGLIPKINKPVFLAGGINYANVKKAINTVNPFAVDINSGAETNGHKDFQKISDIIKLIRGLKNEQ